VVVYAGAVMVLYIFVVAYIGGSDEPLRPEGGAIAVLGPIFAAAVGVALCSAFIASGLDALDTTGPDVAAGFGSPEAIGQLLLTRFLPFSAPAPPPSRWRWVAATHQRTSPPTAPSISSSRLLNSCSSASWYRIAPRRLDAIN
jgi:hypothetical protein